MAYKHIKPKPQAIKIQSINAKQGEPLNDLEATLLCFQKLIKEKVKDGKKGIVLYKGESSEYKMSYEKLQAMLFQLNSLFSMQGCFSFGICANCNNFQNSQMSSGCFGVCGGKDVHMFNSCDSHNGTGGFGKE